MKKLPIRFWVGLMIFCTTCTNYMTRVNISVSIVAMSSSNTNKTRLKADCPVDFLGEPAQLSAAKDYQWSEPFQAQVLGAYFYGYIATCLLAGIICEYLGPFKTIFYCSVTAAVMNSITPYAPLIHESIIIVCRLIIGAAGGLVYPAVQMLMARWAPPAEKGRFMAAMMGHIVGIIVTWPLVGTVSKNVNYQWGFHVLSIIIGLFCVAFFILVTDTPEFHRWVSDEERQYIAEQLGTTVHTGKKDLMPPYFSILTSIRFWALAVAQFGFLWSLYLMTTNLPKFMYQVYAVNLNSLGGITSIPYIVGFFACIVFGNIGDFIKRRGIASSTFVRKFFIIFSHLLSGTFLACIGLIKCNFWVVIGLVTLIQAMSGAIVISHLQNPQDLAPNYCSAVYGLISFIGGTTGFIVPAITGAFTKDASNLKQWSYVFELGAMVYIACGLFFIVFGTAELQSWNEPKTTASTE